MLRCFAKTGGFTVPDVYTCEITGNERLAEATYAITVACPEVAATARAGQFVHVRCGAERLLRRPVSICRGRGGSITLVYEAKGEGTRWISRRKAGEVLDILGPLGNGFAMTGGKIVAVGGGIGAPPLLFAAETAKGAVTAILGFRDAGRIILKDEFQAACDEIYITTDDGSAGIHGTVAAPLEELLKRGGYGAVISCGPRAMLAAVADICARNRVPCQVSLEERMACGVGACLVCACETTKNGAPTMSRVCKDGPVFDATHVRI